MKRISFIQVLGTVLVSSAILTACGGGGGGDGTTVSATTPSSTTPSTTPITTPSTTTPVPVVVPIAALEGIYTGATTNTNRSITALILADNSYYMMYSKMGDPSSFDGVAFGTGQSSTGSFSSSDLKDINLSGKISTGTFAGTYVSKNTFDGTLTYTDNSTVGLHSTYDPTYATAPTLATLAGVYTGTLAAEGLSESGIILTIAADGTMSGKISCGCKIDATITPLASGNAYGVRLTFTGGTHPLANRIFTGSAYFDAGNKRLLVVGLLDTGKPAMFVGTRP